MKKILLSILTLIICIGFSLGNVANAATKIILTDNDSPPGLQGKGGAEFPKGLENSEKTPKGWMHGEKRGWNHHFEHRHHHHQGHHEGHHHHDAD